MAHQLFADLHKDATVGDVHVTTALGNERRRRRRGLHFSGAMTEDQMAPKPVAAPAMTKIGPPREGDRPTRALKPMDGEGKIAHTPFPHDAIGFSHLRQDQIPRFLGAVSDPGRLPIRTVDLHSLTALQDRVDPAKVQAMRGGALRGRTKPAVTRFADRDYIADGHHRLSAEWLDGKDRAEVHYLDLTAVSQALKSASDSDWCVPFEIKKADPDQRLVFGWASVVTKDGKVIVDKQGDIIEPSEIEHAAYDFVLYARDMGDMHTRKGVGRLVESMVFTREKQDTLGINLGMEGWWVGFRCDDEGLWATIKRGEKPEFSIGGTAVPTEIG